MVWRRYFLAFLPAVRTYLGNFTLQFMKRIVVLGHGPSGAAQSRNLARCCQATLLFFHLCKLGVDKARSLLDLILAGIDFAADENIRRMRQFKLSHRVFFDL